MTEQIKYINGIKIGNWFCLTDGTWLHYHQYATQFSKKWHEVKSLQCTCKQIVPEEIQMHGKLQTLSDEGEAVNVFWPVFRQDKAAP